MESKVSEAKFFKVVLEQDLKVVMRDGTILRADVYRPDSPDKFPVLLQRTPYDKSRPTSIEMTQLLAERGYISIIQDVRGRYASEGDFHPGFYSGKHYDAEDGYDTVEWAARLPWSTGKVGTVGNSYCGWTQWELAHTRPPHLFAMLPQGCVANLLDRELSAVPRLGRILSWTIGLSTDQRRRDEEIWGPKCQDEADLLWMKHERSKWLWFLPIQDIPESSIYGMSQQWKLWLNSHTEDNFSFESKHHLIDVPVLNTTGWYDQQIWTTKQFTGMSSNGMTKHARNNQHIMIGPWTHTAVNWDRKVGDIDFGTQAELSYYDIADEWFSYWLKGENNAVADWSPVQIFVMGANQWRSEMEWPLKRTVYTDFFIHSGGNANTAKGDGTLSKTFPSEEIPDSFTYDPRDPLMTLYSPAGQQEPQDQKVFDGRQDVLMYISKPLINEMEVTGVPEVQLYAASSATDTDFVAKLLDVWPDGFTQEICHGILRARYRESYTDPTLIEPGKIYEYTIRLNPTSNLFKEGHQIRLDITSSDFPNFDRNHNTGGDDSTETTLISADQTVFHDTVRPSKIILPVIPKRNAKVT